MLDRELNTLEDNISSETALLRAAALPVPQVLSYSCPPNGMPGLINGRFDSQLSIDCTNGNVTVVMPPLQAKNFGRRFVLIKRKPANAVILACSDLSVKLNNGVFSVALTAVGVTEMFCDSTGYYL